VAPQPTDLRGFDLSPELRIRAERPNDRHGIVDEHRIANLSPLAVAPEHQGRGIGSALV
jgi:ribosomal protein S18 acetylase RimI-like enzyme